jgi:hypothetical protein
MRLFALTLAIIMCVTTTSAQWNEHQRHMERAHPTPDPAYRSERIQVVAPFLLQPAYPSSFLNVNMIIEENDPLPVQNESSIAIDPTNPQRLIAAAVDYRNNSSRSVYVSADGGKTWTNQDLGQVHTGWQSSNDPSVAFSHDGRGYLCYGGFNRASNQSGQNGVFLSITTDGGATWPHKHIAVIEHTLPQTADSAFEDKYYVHVDTASGSPHRGNVYIPWKRVINRDSSTQIVLALSTDKGLTWLAPVNVSDRFPRTSEDTTFGQSFPLARTGPDGSVHVVWNSGTERSIRYARSTDAGVTFTTPRILHTYKTFGTASTIAQQTNHRVKGTVRAECYPSLAVDCTNGPRRGWMYLCWAADQVPNIYFSRSTDGGTTWSTPVIAHTDTTNDQFWPWLAVDPTNGDVGIMYFDSRDDVENLLAHCYVSLSTDGGSTWIDRRVGDDVNDLRNNPFAGRAFAGDYNGCDMRNGIIYPSWVDMRNTVTNAADDDAYTAIVNVRAPAAPGEFTATTIPETPTNIRLEWSAAVTRSFGQPIAPGTLTYVLLRDGVRIDTVDAATLTYVDQNLTPYTKYAYTLHAVIDGSLESGPRHASAYAGGARQPAPPVILSARGTESGYATLELRLPSRRADGVTPLVNLDVLEIAANGVFVYSVDLVPSDSGTVKTVDVPMPYNGWSHFTARVGDAATPTNRSEYSDSMITFVGSYVYYTERFDTLPRMWRVRGDWSRTERFAYSQSGSFTESPDGNYKAVARDTVVLYPVRALSSTVQMSFWHAAFVDPGDTVFVEASTSQGATWSTLGAWNASSVARWADTTKAPDAWRFERLPIPATAGDTIMVRLRMRSNATRHSDGWYVDDVAFSEPSSVNSDDTERGALTARPNPSTGSFVVVSETDEVVRSIECFTTLGEQIRSTIVQEGAGWTVTLPDAPTEAYLCVLTTDRGTRSVIIHLAR